MAEALTILQNDMQSWIAETESAIDQDVQSLCDKMDKNQVMKGGDACIRQVREIREKALNRYTQIKNDLNTRMIELIDKVEDSDGVRQIKEKKRDLSDARSKLEKEQKKRDRINEDNKNLSGYQKFQRYSNTAAPNADDSSLNAAYAPITSALKEEKEEYRRKWIRALVLGISVTLLFAAIDYFLLNSVFIASNMGVRTAAITSALAAIALDVPPYVLGYIISKRTDLVRIWYLQEDDEDPGKRRQSGSLLVLVIIMALAIVPVILAYLFLRGLLFIGGGDIDIIIHSFLENGFRIAPSDLLKVQYNGGDIISAFVPIVTSVSALAIGLLLSASEADYIKKAIVVTNKELDNCVLRCERNMIDYNTDINILQEGLSELKQHVKAFYLNSEENIQEDDFSLDKIVQSGMRLSFEVYLPFYKNKSANLRKTAENKIYDINQKIQPHTTVQTLSAKIGLIPSEMNALDEIWVGDNQKQRQTTEETMRKIEELIQLLSR